MHATTSRLGRDGFPLMLLGCLWYVPVVLALYNVPVLWACVIAWYTDRFALYQEYIEPNRGFACTGLMPLCWLWSSPRDPLAFAPVTAPTTPPINRTVVYIDMGFLRFDRRRPAAILASGNRTVPPMHFLRPLLPDDGGDGGAVTLLVSGLNDAHTVSPGASAAYIHGLVHECALASVRRVDIETVCAGKEISRAFKSSRRVVACNTRTAGMCALDSTSVVEDVVPYVPLSDITQGASSVRTRDLRANRWWI